MNAEERGKTLEKLKMDSKLKKRTCIENCADFLPRELNRLFSSAIDRSDSWEIIDDSSINREIFFVERRTRCELFYQV